MSLADDVAAADHAAHNAMLWPLALAALSYFVAFAVSLIEIESVLVSGPVLVAVGVWLAARAVAARRPTAVLLGAGLVLLVATLFGAVNLWDWSPSEAQAPFATVGAIGGMCLVALAIAALPSQSRPAPVELRAALVHQPPPAPSPLH